MVRQTQPKNKAAHPAAPVMSNTTKVKAGIIPAKPQAKRVTKDAKIQELEAEIARLKNPDGPHPSKEPFVCTLPLFSVFSLTCPSFLVVEVQEVTNLK